MYIFAFIIFLIPGYAMAALILPPECPSHRDKASCLKAVHDKFEEDLKDIEVFIEDEILTLVASTHRTKHHESLACEKTCKN